MESNTSPEIPPSVPLELFLTNLKLYRDLISFYRKKGVSTLEQALPFRDFPSKMTSAEEKRTKFLLNNIRAIRETLPKELNEQIMYLINKEIIFDEENVLTGSTMLKSFKSSTKVPNFCLPNKFQAQNLKPSSLYSANISNRKITKIDINDKFTNLKHLYLNDNFIQKIEYFNCPNLELLDLTNNFIRKIENIGRYPKITQLNLSNNLIYILENLQNNNNLESIDLSNQYIPSFMNFAIHPQCASPSNTLTSINLENNNLMTCTPLGQFPLLREVNIKGNNIIELMDVLNMTKMCPYIEKINVLNNPFANDNKSTYKNFIIISLKNLTEIDGKEVKENERIYVTNLFARKFSSNPKRANTKKDNSFGNGMTITHVTNGTQNDQVRMQYGNLYNYK